MWAHVTPSMNRDPVSRNVFSNFIRVHQVELLLSESQLREEIGFLSQNLRLKSCMEALFSDVNMEALGKCACVKEPFCSTVHVE